MLRQLQTSVAKAGGAVRRAMLALIVVMASVMCFEADALADELPSPMTPARLVNDFAGLMDEQDKAALEDSLVRFAVNTSTQVTVVTVTDLNGYDIAQYAQEIAEKWGVGQKGKDNGVIILVKPKTDDSRGQAYIGTGYGAEGALPDVTCSRIVNEKMIPFFKDGNYSGGIRVGAIAVMQALNGEFEADAEEEDEMPAWAFVVIFLAIVIFLTLASDNGNGNNGGGRHITRSTGDEWITASIIGSSLSGRSSGGFGGGGFGGFGGFGGGSFGGGGGGGSW